MLILMSKWEPALKALANEDTLLVMMFLGLGKLGNICCGHEMFLNKIWKIFVSQTQNLCPQQMLHARTKGEAFVSVTTSPQQCVLICQSFKKTTTAMATGMSLNKRFIINRTMDAHVRYKFWYISLPSSAKQQLEMLSVAHYELQQLRAGSHFDISISIGRQTQK